MNIFLLLYILHSSQQESKSHWDSRYRQLEARGFYTTDTLHVEDLLEIIPETKHEAVSVQSFDEPEAEVSVLHLADIDEDDEEDEEEEQVYEVPRVKKSSAYVRASEEKMSMSAATTLKM